MRSSSSSPIEEPTVTRLSNPKLRKLEIGCGHRPTPDYIHNDVNAFEGVGIVGLPWEIDFPDGSLEEGTYYGTSFLARIGYFDKSKRFWTTRDFPDSEPIRKKILAFIQSHQKSAATGGHYYRGAVKELKVPTTQK